MINYLNEGQQINKQQGSVVGFPTKSQAGLKFSCFNS